VRCGNGVFARVMVNIQRQNHVQCLQTIQFTNHLISHCQSISI